jgi:hypothetical protein
MYVHVQAPNQEVEMKALGKFLMWSAAVVVGGFFLLAFIGNRLPADWTGALTYDAQQHVRSRLRDPTSAQFQSVRLTRGQDENRRVVCGEVNARNALGGFTGYRRFVIFARRVGDRAEFTNLMMEETWPGDFASEWRLNCPA